MRKIGRHDRQCWRAGQCQPQACSSLTARFFIDRGRRKLTISQAIRINDPIAAITNDRVKWRGQKEKEKTCLSAAGVFTERKGGFMRGEYAAAPVQETRETPGHWGIVCEAR